MLEAGTFMPDIAQDAARLKIGDADILHQIRHDSRGFLVEKITGAGPRGFGGFGTAIGYFASARFIS